ncbi:DUF4145 domain-containing protein [Paracoccus sp. 08]|uniref:DUF4145 domain-containing protein n=1 Tax=Paracoccus sp. 08 TaxID=2606624 RepID=UPI002095DB47|nr:DUF4145 domain-containing protein [Paracoccus sp. 08]
MTPNSIIIKSGAEIFAETLVGLVSALAWPAIVVFAIFFFGEPVKRLISRIKSASIAGNTVDFSDVLRDVVSDIQEVASKQNTDTREQINSDGAAQTNGDVESKGDVETSEEAETNGDVKTGDEVETNGDVETSDEAETNGNVETSDQAETNSDANLDNRIEKNKKLLSTKDFIDSDEMNDLIILCEINPALAVIEGYDYVAYEWHALIEELGINDPLPMLKNTSKDSLDNEYISKNIVNSVNGLRKLRNRAAHDKASSITPEDAENYLLSVAKIIKILRSKRLHLRFKNIAGKTFISMAKFV